MSNSGNIKILILTLSPIINSKLSMECNEFKIDKHAHCTNYCCYYKMENTLMISENDTNIKIDVTCQHFINDKDISKYDILILTYDASSKVSFEHIKNVIKLHNIPKITTLMIGQKDIKNIVVYNSDAKAIADYNEIFFFATETMNFDDIIEPYVREIYVEKQIKMQRSKIYVVYDYIMQFIRYLFNKNE